MPSVRGMLSRVAKLEAGRASGRSPIERWFGSMDAFEAEVRADMDAGKVDRIDMEGVLACLRSWHHKGVWGQWHHQRNGMSEFGR